MSGPPSSPSAEGRDALGPLPPGARPAPPTPPPGPSPPSAGGLGRVPAWAAVLATAAAVLVVPALALLPVEVLRVAGVGIDLDPAPPGFLIPATFLLDVGLVLVAYAAVRAFGGRPTPGTFGVRLTPVGRAIAWTLAVYGGFWVLTILYTVALGPSPQQALVDELRAQDSLVVLAGFAVLVGVAAPLGEELFFRGFLFGVLREKIGILAAALVAGAIFGLIHAAGTPVRTLGVLVILGIGLCFLYVKTGSLLPCMGLHALHNSISFAATKEVDPLVGVLIVAGSVGVTLAVALAFARRSRPSPAPV